MRFGSFNNTQASCNGWPIKNKPPTTIKTHTHTHNPFILNRRVVRSLEFGLFSIWRVYWLDAHFSVVYINNASKGVHDVRASK